MALAIGHDGGVTWHCRWCPSEAASSSSSGGGSSGGGALPRLGLLAAALGDGSVRVWAVPQPCALTPQTAPYVAAPQPVAQLSSMHLNGSMPSRVDWLPDPPHDLLLIGCWDGTVAVAKLVPETQVGPAAQQPGGAPVGLRLLLHFPADTQPLRAARWLPHRLGAGTVDLANRCIFMTAGHEGAVKVWDSRDQFHPLYFVPVTTATILDAVWTTDPLGVVAAVEDGSLRALLLEASAIREQHTPGAKPITVLTWRGQAAGALWTVAMDARGSRTAFAGEDGVVGLAGLELKWDKRKRRSPHLPVAGLRVANGAVELLRQAELEAQDGAGLYAEKLVERKDALAGTRGEVPDAAQAVHAVAWSRPTGTGGAQWLASGGAAGLVRCQWVHET